MIYLKKSILHNQFLSIGGLFLMIHSPVVSALPEDSVEKEGKVDQNRDSGKSAKSSSNKSGSSKRGAKGLILSGGASGGQLDHEKSLKKPDQDPSSQEKSPEVPMAPSVENLPEHPTSNIPGNTGSAGTIGNVNTSGTLQGVGARAYVEASSGLVCVYPDHQAGSSVIQEICVKDGDRIHKGQVIAVLSNYPVKEIERNIAREDLSLSKQNVRTSQNKLKAIKKQWERNQKLVSAHSVSQQELEKIDRDLVDAAIDVEKMGILVNIAEQKLNMCEIALTQSQVRAPINGDVLIVNGKAGERVREEDGILVMANLDQMEIVAEVHETDISKIFIGQKAEIYLSNQSPPIIGFVKYKAGIVRSNTIRDPDPKGSQDLRIVEVRLKLSPEDSKRIQGFLRMHVDVRFSSPDQDHTVPVITPANEARAL